MGLDNSIKPRVPWWGYVTILMLIVGGAAIAIGMAEPIYALALAVATLAIRVRVLRRPGCSDGDRDDLRQQRIEFICHDGRAFVAVVGDGSARVVSL